MIDLNKNNEPLDLSYLKEMSGDNAEFMIEMVDVFKVQTPLYIDDLKKAITERDWVKVAGAAHKIKPTFAYVGREDVKDHMQMIEQNARELKDIEALPWACSEVFAFVDVLYGQLDQAKAELEKRL